MKKKYLKGLYLLIMPMILIGLLGGHAVVFAKTSLDMVVTIRDLDDMLITLDDLSLATSSQTGLSPTDMLRGMLQGTEWIDPGRLIVLGLTQVGDQAATAVLIPFQSENENFQKTFNARAGEDYYILGFPPGPGLVVPEDVEEALVDVSKESSDMALSMKIAVSALLANNKPKVEQWLQKIESMPMEPQPSGQPAPSPAEIKEMMSKLVAKAGELRTVTLGIDFDQTAFRIASEADAKKNSDLYRLFSEKSTQSKLGDYITVQDVTFQSLGYDVEGMLDLVDDLFGAIYDKIGLEFETIASLGEHFTGETAGGMTFTPDGIAFEMLATLKEPDPKGEFAEKVYLPWLMAYSKDLSEMMEQGLQSKIDSLYVRTPDSTIKGRKVVGVKFQFPAFPMPGDRDAGAQMGPLMDYSFRMTTVGDLALMAPDDQRLGELIDMAARMKAKPATGPLMQGTVDLGQYLKYLITLMPDTGMAMPELPATGRMKFRMDVKNGQFSSMMTVPMEGIKSLAAYSKQMEAAVQAGAVAQEEPQRRTRQRRRIAEPEETPLASPEEAPPLDPELDPDYWFEKGGLLSTYGNDKAAIPAYKKAIKLDPARSDAYFNLGVSYGEIGEYELALASINKAIELNPTKGLYFYGRARVHLLANDTDKAMADFKRAAEAGNADAQQFLQREGIK